MGDIKTKNERSYIQKELCVVRGGEKESYTKRGDFHIYIYIKERVGLCVNLGIQKVCGGMEIYKHNK